MYIKHITYTHPLFFFHTCFITIYVVGTPFTVLPNDYLIHNLKPDIMQYQLYSCSSCLTNYRYGGSFEAFIYETSRDILLLQLLGRTANEVQKNKKRPE